MSAPEDEPSQADHAYFRALETEFIRLRGAPLLLSPSDWQVAKEWRASGVPLELAVRVMERIFERQADPAKRTAIRGLRYFRAAVDRAWRKIQELGPAHRPAEDQTIDVAERLARLAAALPRPTAGDRSEDAAAASSGVSWTDALARALGPATEGLAERIRALDGDPPRVEAELQRLDGELMASLRRELGEEALTDLERSVRDSLSELSERLDEEAHQRALSMLVDRRLRRELGLPVLSLFATLPDDA